MRGCRLWLIVVVPIIAADVEGAPVEIGLGEFGPSAVTFDFDGLPCASGLPTIPDVVLSAPNSTNGLAGPDANPPPGCQNWGSTSSPGRFSLFFNGLTIDFQQRQRNVGFVFGGNTQNSVDVDILRDGVTSGTFTITSSSGPPDGINNWIFYGFQDVEGIDAIRLNETSVVVGLFDLTHEALPTTYTYVSDFSGNWDDGANWDVGLAPVQGSSVSVTPNHGLNVFGPSGATTLQSVSIDAQTSGVAQLFLSDLGELTILDDLQIGPRGKVVVENVLEVQQTVINDGVLELASAATAQLVGGAIANTGVVTGSGGIGARLTNDGGGRVVIRDGQSLTFNGAQTSNRGELRVLGGTATFVNGVANASTGTIAGRGSFDFGTGLTDEGDLALEGDSSVFGDITLDTIGRVVVTGGASATFFDDVDHNGAAFQISEGSQAIFLGTVSGAGPFTGPGTAFFEGQLSPGNSPAELTIQGDAVLSPRATLLLELGGLLPGDEYDTMHVLGDMSLGGEMDVELINGFGLEPGQHFTVIETAGESTGRFAGLPEGARVGNFGGLDLFISYLGNDGNDVVLFTAAIPEPATVALSLIGILALLPLRVAARQRDGFEG